MGFFLKFKYATIWGDPHCVQRYAVISEATDGPWYPGSSGCSGRTRGFISSGRIFCMLLDTVAASCLCIHLWGLLTHARGKAVCLLRKLDSCSAEMLNGYSTIHFGSMGNPDCAAIMKAEHKLTWHVVWLCVGVWGIIRNAPCMLCCLYCTWLQQNRFATWAIVVLRRERCQRTLPQRWVLQITMILTPHHCSNYWNAKPFCRWPPNQIRDEHWSIGVSRDTQ